MQVHERGVIVCKLDDMCIIWTVDGKKNRRSCGDYSGWMMCCGWKRGLRTQDYK